MRPIDADEVMKIIEFENKWLFDAKSNNDDTDIAFGAMICGINQIPTLDVKPVKQGEWVEYVHHMQYMDVTYHKCSICGSGMEIGKPNFCPTCGAEMINSEWDEYEDNYEEKSTGN